MVGQRGPKSQSTYSVTRRASEGQIFGKRHMVQLESSDRIGDQDLKEQLHLGSERTSGRIFRNALVLEIMKQRLKPSVRIRKVNVRTLWRDRPLLNERKDCTQNKSQRCRSTTHSR
jgi:hypothetical protein